MRLVNNKDKEHINKIARKLKKQCPYFSWKDLAVKTGWSTTTVRRHYDENWYPGKYFQEPIESRKISKDLEFSGLYMLAQRIIEDDKILNLIKVGKSNNIKQRLQSYKGTNPFAKCIDTREVFPEDLSEYEKEYHYLLGKDNIRYGNTEWFICNDEQFKYWTEKGFGFRSNK